MSDKLVSPVSVVSAMLHAFNRDNLPRPKTITLEFGPDEWCRLRHSLDLSGGTLNESGGLVMGTRPTVIFKVEG